MVETIWEGDVKEFSRAAELICIVDQIHDYAVNYHRSFVINHLEAWHARHQKTIEPWKRAVLEINAATAYTDVAHEDSNISDFDSDDISNDSYDFDKDSEMGDFDSDDIDSSSYDFDELAELFGFGPNKPAEWLRLKEQSQNARREIANETRKRNRSLLKIAQAPKSAKEPEKTRPRGRPPKAGVAKKEAPKRGRGRPPKMANKTIKTALKQ
jgi:AT hook motif